MKKKNTSSATANDPKSKINASLRVWDVAVIKNRKKKLENIFKR